jgi:hypothetical protein
MVAYPEKRELPAYLNGVEYGPSLDFKPLLGDFKSKNRGGEPIAITQAAGGAYGFRALLFRTPLNIDHDGNPHAYAPPISVTNLSPQGGVPVKDELRNATNDNKNAVVFFDPDPVTGKNRNKFSWTGVRHVKKDSTVSHDERLFLQDVDGNFPAFLAGSDKKYYAPQTAINTSNGTAVNASEVPYGALGASLRKNGKVQKGDFGFAIRPSTGSFTPFVYADAGGEKSVTVGEYSSKLGRELFGGRSANEDASIIVFPGSAHGNSINVAAIPVRVKKLLHELMTFKNVEDIAGILAGSSDPATLQNIMNAIRKFEKPKS